MRAIKVYAERQTWGAVAYCLIGFPLAIAGFVFVVTTISVSAGLSVTLVGLPLLGLSVAMSRGWGAANRAMGRTFLGVDVERPIVRRRPGILGYIGERNGWRAILFMLIRFPLAIVDFVFAVAFFAYALGALTYPIWWRFPRQRDDHHVLHHGMQFGPHWYADTPGRIALVFLGGVVLALLAPWIVRGVTRLDAALIRGLLGPTDADRRIQSLEETRTLAVDESAAALRRIERDLHDGAQARLVGVAMNLGVAKEELDRGEVSLERIRELVDTAHREAKGTITDLRDLARGIHPPALDNGLADALTTLAARSTLPTTARVELPQRPSAAVETIVYFCTAELLTNAVKHSGAHRASIDVRQTGSTLYLRVHDDGAGGAEIGQTVGSGLQGLADRVATVDGTLVIDSPVGGPTDVTIAIPIGS
ncbi:MAG TPA: sensor domain-containing protein [Mycobacteriales bacterium]|nr:sensor domain-containing protein [Mycobacteriales bacterium]